MEIQALRTEYMAMRRMYRKRKRGTVVAVQFDLYTDGFVYRKWGAEQRCKPGDWIVDNDGDIYTIDKHAFAETYVEVSHGLYQKNVVVWASQVESEGTLNTKEGSMGYSPGDYVVSSHPDGTDSFAVGRQHFESTYVRVDDDNNS